MNPADFGVASSTMVQMFSYGFSYGIGLGLSFAFGIFFCWYFLRFFFDYLYDFVYDFNSSRSLFYVISICSFLLIVGLIYFR